MPIGDLIAVGIAAAGMLLGGSMTDRGNCWACTSTRRRSRTALCAASSAGLLYDNDWAATTSATRVARSVSVLPGCRMQARMVSRPS